ncbi:MAG: carboxymuconolactone decarboxylase family protein [Nitrospinae bacterium]|nr:carboxymuconolactone decarboxylase family protein [Nitrospinota bacterium]
MTRIQMIDPKTATGKTKVLLEQVENQYGMIPNVYRTFANSPAVLAAYLNFNESLAGGTLSPKLREQISLSVANSNGCGYCTAAHCAISSSIGLSEEEISDGRRGSSPDSKVNAALKFVERVLDTKGNVSDEDFRGIKKAGYTDGEITEIVGNIAFNNFSNYFTRVAGTEIDFPAVPELAKA